LQRERERLGLALTAGKMGVYETNPAAGTLWWSPETYSLFGIKPEEFSLTRDSFAERIHPADRELFMQHWDENIARLQPVNREFRILLPDGKERWISCKGLSLAQSDDVGQPLRHTGIFLDITQRKESEQMLRKFDRLSAAARLSAAIAHEINNPLGAVVNLVYLAKAAPGVPESIVEQLALAEQELERVTHAARQALGFYRETAPSERIDVPALIDSVLRIYSSKINDKKIRIKREFVKPARVYAVSGELGQVVANLISNAIDAVAKGGAISIASRTAGSGEDSTVEIVIADDGHGIAPENLDRVFEPFFTTKEGTGTGLGLWVAKEIVERHGGTITVSSQSMESPSRGATFTITMPTATAARPSRTASDSIDHDSPLARNG
jgi:PAS domain S-box-containing protein